MSNKATKQKGSEQAVESITLTKEMYESMVDESAEAAFKKVSRVMWVLIVIAFVCVVTLAWVASRPAQPPQVYTVDPSGQITAINAFDKPPSSPEVLSNLAIDAVMKLFSFNALNYERVIERENRELFIGDKFHRAYVDGVYASSWFERLKSNQMSIRAIPTGMPVVENPSGSYSASVGMRHWLISVPVSLFVEAAGMQTTEIKRTFTIQLVHTRQYEYKAGIGVARIEVSK